MTELDDLEDLKRRVAALEAAQQHVATKADLAQMELRLVNLILKSVAFNAAVTVASVLALGWVILQRLPAG